MFTACGELSCHRTVDGERIWHRSYREDFGAKTPQFGFCDHPLVDGDRLICTPGGTLHTFVALDKRTGEVLWESDRLTAEAPSYSAVMVTAAGGGIRQYVNNLGEGVLGIAADPGQLLWRYEKVG